MKAIHDKTTITMTLIDQQQLDPNRIAAARQRVIDVTNDQQALYRQLAQHHTPEAQAQLATNRAALTEAYSEYRRARAGAGACPEPQRLSRIAKRA
ncbi:MAG: hypothetical protein HC914_19930 [Chloroflexaceae bacterium]|nr:hypothetical protein [Chloroflexaceae bacterium]